jgi:hypothetical protein
MMRDASKTSIWRLRRGVAVGAGAATVLAVAATVAWRFL